MRAVPAEAPLSEDDLRRARGKAREFRNSQWWKNRRGQGVCYYCGRRVTPKELTMDHIVPLIRGGKSTRSNVVPCCESCNKLKADLVPSEWAAYLERLSGQRSDP